MTIAMPGTVATGRKAANAERVKRAKVALAAWIPKGTDGFSLNTLDTDVLGLMVDLLHFAHKSKQDVKELLDLSKTNFDMELGEVKV